MNLLKRFLNRFWKEETLCCPRCQSHLQGEAESGFLYCQSCNTSFETIEEIRYDEPTKGITYRLNGKSLYGRR